MWERDAGYAHPESKGKVESGVKYVKQNGLYGETFTDWKCLETYVADWLILHSQPRMGNYFGRDPYRLINRPVLCYVNYFQSSMKRRP